MKKMRLLVSVLAMALMMTGCAAKDNPTDTPATEDPNQVTVPEVDTVCGETNLQSYPLTSEKVTLEFWYPVAGSMGTMGDLNEGDFWKWYEEKTNVHINFTIPAAGSEKEAFNMLFMSDSMPDIIYTYPAQYKYRDGMDAAIDDGYIMDLAQHLDWAPNYCSWINNLPDARKNVFTDTGKIYGFWGFQDSIEEKGYTNQGMSIRKDFLDKVGKDIPETYAEWEDVLTAFRDELGIEAPFYTSKYGIDNGEFMAGFGVAPYWYRVDQVVKYGPMQDEYKEYLAFMHDWYEKGLLDHDFDTRKSNGIAADNDMILNDKIGALVDYGTRMTDAYISRGATNPEFWAVAAPQPKKSADAEDPKYYDAMQVFGEMRGNCLLIAAETEYPEIATRWVDGFYGMDVANNANFGVEDKEGIVWYKTDDGQRMLDFDFRYNNPDGMDSATVLVKYWTKNPPIEIEMSRVGSMPEDRAASYKVWNKYDPEWYMPLTLTMTQDEGTEYAQLYTEIELYVQEMNVKFIKGTESLDNYDAYREELKKLGIERCTEIQQASLDRYNNR